MLCIGTSVFAWCCVLWHHRVLVGHSLVTNLSHVLPVAWLLHKQLSSNHHSAASGLLLQGGGGCYA